ncbi:hypothetical protein PBPMD00_20 [Pinkberry virus LS07-2018-MD00]|jgi:hypothetical protein|nr:hypothetical protein PBPMD00_20 [Pinkberry virus LS07-2018-MD00]
MDPTQVPLPGENNIPAVFPGGYHPRPEEEGNDGIQQPSTQKPRWEDPAFEGSLDGSFEPVRPEGTFETMEFSLILPPITESVANPVKKCNEQCAEMKKNIRKECNIMRKRVQEALKEKGCPSRITAYTSKRNGC